MNAASDFDQPPRQPNLWGPLRLLAVAAVVVVAGLFIINQGARLGQSVGERLGPVETDTPAAVVTPGISVEVEIPFGSSATRVAEIMMAAGVISDSGLLLSAVQDAGVAGSIQAGTYQLITGVSVEELLVELLEGPVAPTYRITVFAGQRLDEILDILADASRTEKAQFTEALLDGSVVSSLVDQTRPLTLQSWEGLLFPDTYEFRNEAGPVEILQRLADTMEQRFSLVDWSGLEAGGLTPYQGIVIASIIEAEVRIAEERAVVSSVLRNRLDDGMVLQMDSTVLYAVGTRDVALFDPDLDSPYNTYRVQGLPPTPIAAPSFSSLQAAAAPADTEYRFFVLSSTDGQHTFSVTAEEHFAAVDKARADGVLP
ncbi:MAG: endolytic transglycosylase MltG [bacterium]|nr:endolytic transglycosylase MltG [bacterium]MDE0602195.1 endolytic transglycosylase MltG [bacterium]